MPLRLVMIAFALIASVFAGTVAGNAVVGGMNGLGSGYALPSIGDEQASLATLDDAPEGGAMLASATVPPPADDCADCAAFEAGYRWAVNHQVRKAVECDGDSTAFADGCAAYVGDRAS